mmetsp:Transcript_98297/g.158509  ORF Transcript_98297/g.158509 Transcript_98297/m.158509 type:complete len:188 (+) Transcript_98297:42-605(+)
MAAFPEKRRWLFGMEGLSRNDPSRQQLISTSGALSVEPYGQMEAREEGQAAKKEVTKEKKQAYLTSRAWEIATSPGKQFMMTAFMMWMMGSGVHIMNIIFTFYQIVGPVQGLFKVGTVFKGLEESAKEQGVDLLLQKLVYVAAQGAVLLYILHRFGNMGLLPTSAGDWVSGIKVKNPHEFTIGGFPF